MARQWTVEQKNAIEARGGSVLVSAAAGSGKTAVLVERVVGRLCDEQNPCDADRLLIVTFTRAAAAEMRERITAAVNDKLRTDPENLTLRRQQVLLPNAKICTIDSFCSSLVRDSFEKLDISPDFKTIDDAQQSILRQQAMDSVLEYMYSEGGEGFQRLSELFYSGRDDSALGDVIGTLYNNSRAYPFPEVWLDSLKKEICSPDIRDTCWCPLILSYVKDAMHYCLHLIHSVRQLIEGDTVLEAKTDNLLSSDEAQLKNILEYAENSDWDKVYNAVSGFVFVKRPTLPKEYRGSNTENALSSRRDAIKSTLKKLTSYVCTSEAEFISDAEFFSEPVDSLIECVKLFSREFTSLKAGKNAVDFADIEHMALSLLVDNSDVEMKRTQLADELSQFYEEILIDEYQDTNEAQDLLFRALSRSETNLFRVGDVKQSIYRFRQAMPDIFLKLRRAYNDYDGESFPSKINLGCNFRSRSEVTDSVNFVFSQLMSEACGELDYDEGEALVARADYPDADGNETELHVLCLEDEDSAEKDNVQAEYVASLIKQLLDSGRTVNDKSSGVRPLQKKDICVLLRSVSKRGALYSDVFRKNGIESFTEASTDFFEATEVACMLSLLRVIDNPRQDVPLIAVMLSPIFGFTPDETALLRTRGEGDCLYSRAVYLANNGNSKYADFLESLSQMRLLSTSLCADELVRRIYEQTGYLAAVSAMTDGQRRRANLLLLIDYASSYEQAGYIGLAGFIRFVDMLDRNEKTLSGSLAVSDTADIVKIMSIHKSKGLEFPVVIIGNCAGKFNTQDEKGGFVLDPMLGMGLKRRDGATLARYDTVSCAGARLSLRRSSVSEEMRVLYVAMTRAREKLILVSAVKKAEKTLSKLAGNIFPGRVKAEPFWVSGADSYSDWLLGAYLRHRDCGELRSLAGASDDIVIFDNTAVKLVISEPGEAEEREEAEVVKSEPDNKVIEDICARLSYSYKYSPLSGILTKRTASGINEGALDLEHFASQRPSFLSQGELSGAQRGTAVHRFMQFCDYEMAASDADKEKQRLISMGLLSEKEAEAIELGRLKAFFESTLYSRIKNSTLVYREKRFMIQVPLRELYELPEYIDEKQLVQGVADCAFEEDGELVIVDFKTDRISSADELASSYSAQMRVYARALSECTGLCVKQTVLWSFYQNKEIVLNI